MDTERIPYEKYSETLTRLYGEVNNGKPFEVAVAEWAEKWFEEGFMERLTTVFGKQAMMSAMQGQGDPATLTSFGLTGFQTGFELARSIFDPEFDAR